MNYLESLLLGGLQGLSEFLPISSSGHLALAKLWFDIREVDLLFITILHLGTLAAIISVYSKNLKTILSYRRVALLTIAVLPSIIGVWIQAFVEQALLQPIWIGAALLATGSYLLLTKKNNKFRALDHLNSWERHITYPKAFLIGIAQVAAMFPGISRSGWTVTTAILLNIPPRSSAFFSFLMAIPTILAAGIWEINQHSQILAPPQILPLTLAFISSYLVGFIALKCFIRALEVFKLYHFSFYLLPLGLFVILNELL